MAFFHFNNVRVAGIAAGVPSTRINNLELEERISSEYDNEEFVNVTGVIERRFDNSLTTSDMCFAAANRLLEDLEWNRKDVDAIIVVSLTLDFTRPATSCIMQDKLGLSKECYAEDIQQGCSGWVYGMSNVASLMRTGEIKKALLCVGDGKGIKYDPLFGFAGVVTALEYDEGNDGLYCHYGTDGSGYEAIIMPEGAARNPFTPDSFKTVIIDGKSYDGFTPRMKGMDVFAFGISTAPKSIKALAKFYGFDYMDADILVLHQANKKMNEAIVKKLKFPYERVIESLSTFGNTSSASIPLTLVKEFENQGKIDGIKIIGCGFGVGLSWGTIAFEAKNLLISKLVEVNENDNMI